ncbi:SEC14 cytosolic factor family protein [Actinidia rufa]|uniref:SEC14 cytosolic factor family protein n=1 Tax=Actinidia rufa TaxID=165716 RepID=A0A7J0FHI8_9ERIC|nr:SEC14 cytosolic factor family protein [Actinidia rufa]
MGSSTSDDFSVLVLASDLGVDARPFLSPSDASHEENWHDCPDEDFSDLEALQFFRIVGKYFPDGHLSEANFTEPTATQSEDAAERVIKISDEKVYIKLTSPLRSFSLLSSSCEGNTSSSPSVDFQVGILESKTNSRKKENQHKL